MEPSKPITFLAQQNIIGVFALPVMASVMAVLMEILDVLMHSTRMTLGCEHVSIIIMYDIWITKNSFCSDLRTEEVVHASMFCVT